ncbi:MAG: hypothetical protein ABIQ95_14595 [Bdellovibrionia bacterium]
MKKMDFKTEYLETMNFFDSRSVRNTSVNTWKDVRTFVGEAAHKAWVYVILFSEQDWIYSWGTASGRGDRLKKTGLLHPKLTGKYDRRGDYLMLKAIYGPPIFTVFEIENAVEAEQERRLQIYRGKRMGSCFRGFLSDDRDSITIEVFEKFKTTARYQDLEDTQQRIFEEFIVKFYLAKLRHPVNLNRTFYYGDCLEPHFLARTLSRPDIEEVVALALNVEF